MTGNRRKTKRFCIYLLLFSILMTSIGGISASAVGSYVNGDDSMYRTSLDDVESFLTATTYAEYLESYKDIAVGDYGAIDLKNAIVGEMPENATEEQKEQTWSSGAIYWDESYPDAKGVPVLIAGDNSVVTFKIDIKNASRYNIRIVYHTGEFDYSEAKDVKEADRSHLTSKRSAAERYILIDGVVPYKEARSIEFEKVWTDVYTYVDDKNVEHTYLATDPAFKEFVLNQGNMSADSGRLFLTDANGNELKPDKAPVATWVEDKYVTDSTGYYSEPLSFYFSEGEHTISLQAIREPLAIKAIYLEKAPENISYEEYSKKYANVPKYNGDAVKIQAEYPVITSGNTIYALNDRSSALSEPQDAAEIRLNVIGGDKWQYVGQWIEWEVDVPQDGMYSIVPRFQQSFYSGMYVSRRIYINGKLPFEEANNLRFSYSSEWQTAGLNSGDVNNPYLFYLEKGVNKIRFEVVLGDMAEILSTVETSLSSINEYYRKILMITGPDPDEYRDYGFDKLIPDVINGLNKEYKTLSAVSARLTELVGEKGDHSTTLDRVALVCQRMSEMPDTIASQMGTLKDYSASLGSWLSDTQNQPLKIDYILLQAPSAELPEAEPGFFASLWYEIQKFIESFFSDYNSLGSNGEVVESSVDVEVWTMTSRDQAQIIRTMVDDNFTPNYEGINVEIKLVVGGALLPSTLAGTGPDVFIGAAQGDPVNYAIRSAVLSLNTKTGNSDVGYNFTDLKNSVWYKDSKYDAFHKLIDKGVVKDLDEVKTWFAEESFVPLTLYGETYALPLTMSFSMMFYRKDMFVEMGIDVPNTWDDFYDIIYTMQSNSLDIGFPAGVGGSTILMYQQDEPLYDEGNYDYYLELFQRYVYDGDYEKIKNNSNALKQINDYLVSEGLVYIDDEGNYIPKTDGMTINLDSDVSLATFKEVCELFTMFDFPVTYEFANRFRSGEMPIAIADYTTYNTLIVFAPEINGLWEFTPLPGTPDPRDPSKINNATIGAVSTIMMMRSAAEDEAVAFGSWAFMQWYVSAEIQSTYGNEMIALLGPSAKQPTANLQALENMAWSTEESNNLMSQFNQVVCTPEFPGSYIISRYTSFAFLDVVNNDSEPVEEMQSQITDINVELTRKREEFGLPTTDSIREMLKAVESKYSNWDEGR